MSPLLSDSVPTSTITATSKSALDGQSQYGCEVWMDLDGLFL